MNSEPTQAASTSKPVPEATLRRLPLYHRFLKELREKGAESVSCPTIGADLHLDPTQIRKDLETAGVTGRPKVGYVLSEIIEQIEHFLGLDNIKDAFLAGAGSLGTALMGYMRFEEHGLSIVAAFDHDPVKIATKVRGRQVLAIDKLPELAKRMGVHIGIITVPAAAAQAVADLMVQGGILAIWNFAPVRLRLPENVIIRNEDLYVSLAGLSQKLEVVMGRKSRTEIAAAAIANPLEGEPPHASVE